MEWFKENHPVEFSTEEESTFAKVETDSGERGADYAWIDRYLYVTVMGKAENIVHETTHLWKRAAIATFDGRTETATDVTLIIDTNAGADDEVAAVQFGGIDGYGGQDVMYALAMKHEFRFRSYSAQSPTNQIAFHPAAFDFVSELNSFVEELHEATGIEPTDSGLEFLRNDPAATPPEHGTRDASTAPSTEQRGLDRVTVVDTDTGEVTAYDSPEEVPEDGTDSGFMSSIRRLLGG
ncbi:MULTISPECIES: hypothetical protein [unclassified Haladaptatus]|uniref:hypothetical protein n=1 Tax=unclassified Haladaptatus TaxID=2622732 RepID=UPI0023E7D07F|nr:MULTISPECIES: hypothetical protein [unclassified Haladaptatus]